MEEPPQVQGLPHYSGLPVPWIALWEGEQIGPDMEVGADGSVRPAPGSKHIRKEFGLWCITTPDNRTGKPDFGSTQSRRQRESMQRMICQICGRTPRQSRSTHLWVVPNEAQHRELWENGSRLMLNAPVCPSCLEFAETVCPHLIHTKPWNVTEGPAQPVAITGDFHTEGGWWRTMLPLRHPLTSRMVGRELVVRVAG